MTGAHKYVALLRGINVGGKNLIKMAELKACFENAGYQNVRTHIQSGNVLFESPETDTVKLTGEIEKILSKTFNYKPVVVVRSDTDLKEVVNKAPSGFGDPGFRYDVIFLKDPATPKEFMPQFRPREGVDTVTAGKHVVYFSRDASQLTKSRVSLIVALPIYQSMTIRNWNTTVKLLKMMEES